jgi:hypothetical protein
MAPGSTSLVNGLLSRVLDVHGGISQWNAFELVHETMSPIHDKHMVSIDISNLRLT